MDLRNRTTESRNPNTKDIDRVSTSEILFMMNDEDRTIPDAVRNNISSITNLVEAAFEKLKNGGRVIYIGAGTSGRLGVLDASECPPTFGVNSETFTGIIAGGTTALQNAIEGAEDDTFQSIEDLKQNGISQNDFLIGIASSGRTPYVLSALKFAKSQGITTGSITCSLNSEISKFVDYPIEVITGPEIISGSTRLKAGTAQKLVLNMISTSLMIKLGKVYSNYMVDLKITNHKLYQRAINMLVDILDVNDTTAAELLNNSENNVKLAIIMDKLSLNLEQSKDLLFMHDGHLSELFMGKE